MLEGLKCINSAVISHTVAFKILLEKVTRQTFVIDKYNYD